MESRVEMRSQAPSPDWRQMADSAVKVRVCQLIPGLIRRIPVAPRKGSVNSLHVHVAQWCSDIGLERIIGGHQCNKHYMLLFSYFGLIKGAANESADEGVG
jgi:hypothetical protein